MVLDKYILFCWVLPAPGPLSSDVGGAWPTLWSQNARKERAGSYWNHDFKKIPPHLAQWFGAHECFVKLPEAYCSRCCWAFQKAAPRDPLAWLNQLLSLVVSALYLAGRREPAIFSCLSGTGLLSPAILLSLTALTPAVIHHPAHRSFSQSPLQPPPLIHFLAL